MARVPRGSPGTIRSDPSGRPWLWDSPVPRILGCSEDDRAEAVTWRLPRVHGPPEQARIADSANLVGWWGTPSTRVNIFVLSNQLM